MAESGWMPQVGERVQVNVLWTREFGKLYEKEVAAFKEQGLIGVVLDIHAAWEDDPIPFKVAPGEEERDLYLFFTYSELQPVEGKNDGEA